MNTSLPKARPGWLALALGAGLLAACASDSGTPPEIDPCDLSVIVQDQGEPGVIYTFAGTGRNGFIKSPNQVFEARFSQPYDLVFDDGGVAFVSDWNNHMVRRIDPDGTISTVVGFSTPFPGDGPDPLFEGYDDVAGPIEGQYCLLNHPTEMNPLPDGTFLLTAWHNHKIRIFHPDNNTEQVVIGRGAGYGGDALVHLDWDDNLEADLRQYHVYRSATSGGPYSRVVITDGPVSEFEDAGVALGRTYYYVVRAVNDSFEESGDSNEIMVVAEPGAGSIVVRDTGAMTSKAAPTAPSGLIGIGDGPLSYGDPRVRMAQPNQSELGPDGHLYILDQRNQRIRRVRDFMTDPNGIIETVAGTGKSGYNGDGLTPLETQFYFDSSTNPDVSGGMVISDDGIIYVSDTKNRVVRAIDLTQNVVNVIAGQPGIEGATGDDVDALSATLSWPLDLDIGPDGLLYLADEHAHAIRALDFDTGKIHTVAGQLGMTSESSECNWPTSKELGDGLPATDAFLNRPRGIAFDPDGRLYIVDTFHNRIRVMTLESTP